MPPRKTAPKPQLRNVAAILNRETITEPTHLIALEKIHAPTKQPRRFFDVEKLAQLKESIQEFGILEPLLVRPLKNGGYELVAGERRLRAARDLGLKEVPSIVRHLDDRQAIQVALIENLQREDLNPVEETDAILDLLAITLNITRENVISLFHQAHHAKHRGQKLGQNVLSQLEIAQIVMSAMGRFTIDSFRASRLPLLNLPDDVLSVLLEGKLEYTKAQAIARVKDQQQRVALLKQAVTKKLSLSDIKAKIQSFKDDAGAELTLEKAMAKQWSEIAKRLQKTKIWGDQRKKNRIKKLLDELDRLTSENE